MVTEFLRALALEVLEEREELAGEPAKEDEEEKVETELPVGLTARRVPHK